MTSETSAGYEKYYVPEKSALAICATIGLVLSIFGAASIMNDMTFGEPGQDTSSWTIFNIGLWNSTEARSIHLAFAVFLAFTAFPTEVVLHPGQTRLINVTFAPDAAGPQGGSLFFASDDPDSPHVVALTGAALTPPAIAVQPGTIDSALFVGGTIPRKGIRLLLDTYRRTFTRDDDVINHASAKVDGIDDLRQPQVDSQQPTSLHDQDFATEGCHARGRATRVDGFDQ